MKFIPISIDNYIKKHLKSNPDENEKTLRKHLESALADYRNGVKCSCGDDIWVIGSAAVGNRCFTCITGERKPDSNYEIDYAIKKNKNKKGLRHIDEIDKTKIHGFFDDDGYEINEDLIKKPDLCVICVNDNDPNEEVLCDMTRFDQQDNKQFKCFAFKKK